MFWASPAKVDHLFRQTLSRLPLVFLLTSFLSFGLLGCGGSSSGSGGTQSQPDFSLVVSPASLALSAGTSDSSGFIRVLPLNGFTGTVTLSFSGVPSGVGVLLPIVTIDTSGSTNIILTASPTAPLVSNQTITVQAVGGGITHTGSISLTVTAPQPPDFTISAPSTLDIYPGVNTALNYTTGSIAGYNTPMTVTLSGLPPGITNGLSSFSILPGNSAGFGLQVAANASTSATVTLTATSGTITHVVQTKLNVITTPDFSFGVMGNGIYPFNGSSFNQQVFDFVPYNGFNAPVTITIGAIPDDITISPTTFTIPSPGHSPNITITVPQDVPPRPINIPVQATSGTLSHSITWTMDVQLNGPIISVDLFESNPHAGSFTTAVVDVTTNATNDTIGTSTLSVISAPAGITVSPMVTNFTGQGAQLFNIQAASNAQNGNIIFQDTWNGLSVTTTLPITVLAASSNSRTSTHSRNAYIRSDSTADYLAFPPPNWSLYDSASARFFAADYGTSRLNVYDSISEKQIASLVIPGAFGIGQAAGKGPIYVGTTSGDIYVVDPAAMAVTQRIASSSIGSSGFSANAVFPRPDGTLLLESYFLLPGYDWNEGDNQFVVWNPSTNALTTLAGCSNDGPPRTTFGILTNNGARLLAIPQNISSPATLLCSTDLATGDMITLAAPSGTSSNRYINALAVSPDGNTVAGFDGAQIWVLDAATLNVKNKFTTSSSASLAHNPSMLIGTDNQTVYITGGENNHHILAYNMSTGQLIGWTPSIELNSQDDGTSVPFLQGLSANGLLGGVMEQGFGFIDINAMNPPPIGTSFGASTLSIASGPTSGGTDTTWRVTGASATDPSLGSTYFGTAPATELSVSNDIFYAISPAGSPGPVNVTTVTPDGGEQLLPEGFSYGPFILEAPTTYATAEGGGPAQVYGYGLGPYTAHPGVQIVAPPADLQVLVGGAGAQVTGYLGDPFSSRSLSYSASPFPLVGAVYTVPPGIAGNSVPITVNNSIGTTTAAQKLTYLPATVSYPVSGAALYDGVYDSTRDLYYFTDATQIQVFSRSQRQWLAPIPVPPPAVPYGPERLLALTLSPDNSKLVVSDAGSIAVDLIDLANGNHVQSFGLALSNPPARDLNTITPAGVAVTNSGQIFFDTFNQNSYGAGFLYALDPSTGKYSNIGGTQSAYGPVGNPTNKGNFPWARLLISPDGQTIYFADKGQIGAVDTSTMIGTSSCQVCVDLTDGGFEMVLGTDGSTLFADGAFVDTAMNLRSLLALNHRETFDADYIYGAALSADNTLLFQPDTQAIDVFDTRTGTFLERVSLPQSLNPNYRALVANGKDNVLLGINAAGNAVFSIDLSSLPAAPPIAWITHSTDIPSPRISTSSTPAPPHTRRANPAAIRYHHGLIPSPRRAPRPALLTNAH